MKKSSTSKKVISLNPTKKPSQKEVDKMIELHEQWANSPYCAEKGKMTNFRGMDLSGIQFNECNLSNANFRGAILHKARFYKVRWKWVDFEGADLSHASMESSHFIGSKFAEATIHDTHIEDCNFDKSSFCSVDFSKTNLGRFISFDNCGLRYCNFHRQSLCCVSFRDAVLEEADFSELNKQKHKDADHKHEDERFDYFPLIFNNADLRSSRFINADVSDADFCGACLADIDKKGRIMKQTEADFSGALTPPWEFDERQVIIKGFR